MEAQCELLRPCYPPLLLVESRLRPAQDLVQHPCRLCGSSKLGQSTCAINASTMAIAKAGDLQTQWRHCSLNRVNRVEELAGEQPPASSTCSECTPHRAS